MNSAWLITPHSSQITNKHRLVPFGEYIPAFQLLRPFFERWSMPMSFLTPGTSLPIVHLKAHPLAILICFDVFDVPWTWRATHLSQAMVVITDDNWFQSQLPIQLHLNTIKMRVLETQKPAVFVNESGRSQIIPVHLQKQKKPLLILHDGNTPVILYGPWFGWLVLLFLACYGCRSKSIDHSL